MKRIFTLCAIVAMVMPCMAQSVTVTSNRFVSQGQTMTVHYENAPVGTDAWVGIYKSGAHQQPKKSYKWAYTDGSSGDLTFELADYDAYFAVLFKDGNYDEIARSEYVLACNDYNAIQAAAFEMKTDKTEYEPGEPVKVIWKGAPAFNKDWVGIYDAKENPGLNDYQSTSYAYITGSQGEVTLNAEGALNFDGEDDIDGPGQYYIAYLLWDGYAEVFGRAHYTVKGGTGVSTVTGQASPEAVYNIAGQRVRKPQKGLYIMNGKKTLF